MGLWWDLHTKYEESLLNHTTFETDEEQMEGLINIQNTPPKRPKKFKKKGKNQKESIFTSFINLPLDIDKEEL